MENIFLSTDFVTNPFSLLVPTRVREPAPNEYAPTGCANGFNGGACARITVAAVHGGRRRRWWTRGTCRYGSGIVASSGHRRRRETVSRPDGPRRSTSGLAAASRFPPQPPPAFAVFASQRVQLDVKPDHLAGHHLGPAVVDRDGRQAVVVVVNAAVGHGQRRPIERRRRRRRVKVGRYRDARRGCDRRQQRNGYSGRRGHRTSSSTGPRCSSSCAPLRCMERCDPYYD